MKQGFMIMNAIPTRRLSENSKNHSFENLNLYKSIVYKQDFLKKVYSRTAS